MFTTEIAAVFFLVPGFFFFTFVSTREDWKPCWFSLPGTFHKAVTRAAAQGWRGGQRVVGEEYWLRPLSLSCSTGCSRLTYKAERNRHNDRRDKWHLQLQFGMTNSEDEVSMRIKWISAHNSTASHTENHLQPWKPICLVSNCYLHMHSCRAVRLGYHNAGFTKTNKLKHVQQLISVDQAWWAGWIFKLQQS